GARMSLIGIKVKDIVPDSANVLRTEKSPIPDSHGNPTQYTRIDQFLDIDGDGKADFKKITLWDPKGNAVGGTFYVTQDGGSGPHEYDGFGDENSDGVIDTHWYGVESKGSNGGAWETETYGYIDRNFDGMTDYRYRLAGGAGDGLKEWILEDKNFDGTYD